MAKPLVDLPDAERQVIDILEDVGHTNVSTEYPAARLAGSTYHLHVDLETSDVADYPVTERAQVRITGHVAPGRDTAIKALMSDVLADLYAAEGYDAIAGIVPLSGRSDVSTDPATQNRMCWVLVRVDLLAVAAS